MTPEKMVDEIVCIGILDCVKVNAYHSHLRRRPVVEVLNCTGRIALSLAQTKVVLGLLKEAIDFWKEAGNE